MFYMVQVKYQYEDTGFSCHGKSIFANFQNQLPNNFWQTCKAFEKPRNLKFSFAIGTSELMPMFLCVNVSV